MRDDPQLHATDLHDQHFLHALGRLGNARRVVVAQPIYSSTGVKLLDAGATVSSRTLERLFDHRLARPLDQAIDQPPTLRSEAVVAQARRDTGHA